MSTSSELRDPQARPAPGHDVLRAAVVLLVVASVALRGWLIARAWYLSDDFILLDDAERSRFDLTYLFTPHDSHLMPWGRAVVWLATEVGSFAWWPAATVTIAMMLLAAAACAWMLVEVFGWRARILIPLAFYLFTPLTIDSMIWWAAALNALPLHVGFFLCVAFAVRYTRTGSRGWLAACFAAFALALTGDPRALQLAPTIALVVVLFFGRPGDGPVMNVLRRWRLWSGFAALGFWYLLLYRETTPSPVTTDARITPWETLLNALGRSWLTGVVGGPWHYDDRNPPAGFVDPPLVLNVLAGLAMVLLVAAAVRYVPSTLWRVTLIMGVHLAITMTGLVLGRATQIGPSAGLLMRFFGDTALTASLCIALLVMTPLGGRTRELPLPTGRLRRPLQALGVLALAGAVVTTFAYCLPWRSYPARSYVTTAAANAAAEPTTVADVPVPNLVQTQLSFPYNLPSRLFTPISENLRGADHGTDLQVLDRSGTPQQAVVARTVTSAPGPAPDCGYRVDRNGVSIPMANGADFWWMAISYLAPASTDITIFVNGRRLPTMEVLPGVHSWYVQGDLPFQTVRMRTTTDTTVCVDALVLDGTIEPIR